MFRIVIPIPNFIENRWTISEIKDAKVRTDTASTLCIHICTTSLKKK